MGDAEGIDDDHRLSGRGDVAADSIGHLESVTASMPNADVCAPPAIGDDPGGPSTRVGSDEPNPQPGSIAEIRGVDYVDHGYHVPARSIPIERIQQDEQSAEQHDPDYSENRSHDGVAFDDRSTRSHDV